MLNTILLTKFFKEDKYARKIFCGVIPLNFLPLRRVRKNCGFIVNTHYSDQPGEHWFAIFVPKFGPIEYFDSFGRYPEKEEIKQFIEINGGKFIYNDKIIQGIKSENCGKFTIFYIYFRARGLKLKHYQKMFTSNKEFNDILIERLFEKVLKK